MGTLSTTLPLLALCLASSAEANDGIVVRGRGGIVVGDGTELRVSGSVRSQGELRIRGRLVVGGDLTLSAHGAHFEPDSWLVLPGPGTHRLQIPPDLALWTVVWGGRLEGELRPVFAARGPPSRPRLASFDLRGPFALPAGPNAALASGGRHESLPVDLRRPPAHKDASVAESVVRRTARSPPIAR